MEDRTRKILVINGKGGCGKTTIATNLAVTFSKMQHTVALMDNDPQGSSTHWAEVRPKGLDPVSLSLIHI